MFTLEYSPQNVSACNKTIQIPETNVLNSRNDASQKSHSESLGQNTKSAFMSRIMILSYENRNDECLVPAILLNESFNSLKTEINSFLKVNYAMKFNMGLHAIYTKTAMSQCESNQFKVKIFKTEIKDIFCIEYLEYEFPTLVKNIIRAAEQFEAKEGGWTLLQLVKVEFYLNKYQPLKISCYIYLPNKLNNKGTCVNIRSRDEFCFKWAVIAAIADIDDAIKARRPSSYNVNICSEIIELKSHVLNFRGLCFPLRVRDVSVFEENNPGISITVFGYDKRKGLVVGPYYKTKQQKDKHINLMFFEHYIEQRTIGHFIWIKHLSRLKIKAPISGSEHDVTICDTCLQNFSGKKPQKHICKREVDKFFEEDKCVLDFKNYEEAVDVPFVVYAKSECLFQNDKTCNPVPYALTYFIKCSYDDYLSKWRSFKGSNALKQFAESLIKDAKYYYSSYSIEFVQRIPLTEEENSEYDKNDSCCICLREIRLKKVKAHCRLTGNYIGPAHHDCALYYTIPKKFPVIFYNLSYNESLLFIKVFNDIDDDPINVRALNNESSICFTKDISIGAKGRFELRFLNLCSFMPFSLDSLLQNMPKSDFKTLKLIYPDEENKFNLVLRRGNLPCKYLDSFEKLTETSLPSIDYFYNTTMDKECSQEYYAHAKNIWTEFECETLEDYLLVCINMEVILLTDTFEYFRLVCKNAYNLDPCNYHSATDFSWDAMLKITDIKIELITDVSMIFFIQQAMRRPLLHCFRTHSVANNKYLCDYNDKLTSKYVMSFYANDLYGRAMSEPLPDGNFEWETDVKYFSVESIPKDSKVGYILEVDLQYPNEIHGIHKMFPFCMDSNEEFVVNLNHKYNYIIYYKNLQQCLQHGLKLKKIHRILKFNQSDWLKKYISLNKSYKSNAKTPFEFNVFEVINNALYEKIMEKVKKRIKIMRKWENEGMKLGARAFIVNPEFSSVTIYDENTVALEFNINSYRYMPIYLEFVISELAKLKLYSFHYEYLIPKYERNVQLNYIDTDSLIYTISTNDLYKDLANDIHLMFNTLDRNSIHDNRLSLKTLGMMKDANDGNVVKEFLGLAPKLYSLRAETMKITNKATNVCNYTTLSDYKNLLYNKRIYCENVDSFKIRLHQRYTKLFKELDLSNLDDNKYIYKAEINDDDIMDVE